MNSLCKYCLQGDEKQCYAKDSFKALKPPSRAMEIQGTVDEMKNLFRTE